MKPTRRRQETQYHLHATLLVESDQGSQRWDTAINVGTDDSDDLLKYRLIFDFHHAIRDALTAADAGFHDLTGTSALPALDFLRSDLLAETGRWRESDVLDGSGTGEPAASLARLLRQAHSEKARIFSGCKSRPATLVAPAGSNRSGGGGNETAGAFDVKGRLGDSASRQAVTRVNAEQAPKGLTWEPTRRRNGEGRRHWETGGHTPRSDSNQWSHRGIGDGMSAEEIRRNTGSPERWSA